MKKNRNSSSKGVVRPKIKNMDKNPGAEGQKSFFPFAKGWPPPEKHLKNLHKTREDETRPRAWWIMEKCPP
jgi:hypothetical protein